jgi:hypothetical protein
MVLGLDGDGRSVFSLVKVGEQAGNCLKDQGNWPPDETRLQCLIVVGAN